MRCQKHEIDLDAEGCPRCRTEYEKSLRFREDVVETTEKLCFETPLRREGATFVGLPEGTKTVVGIVVYKDQCLVATDTGVYRVEDGLLLPLKFVEVPHG